LSLAIRSLWIVATCYAFSLNCCHLLYVLSELLPLAIRSLWIVATCYTFSLNSLEITLLFVLSGVLSEGLSFKCACKSSSFCRNYIPTWSRLLFWNCTNFMSVSQLVVLFLIKLTTISWISLLDLSTVLWDWGCIGLPWTITSSGHNSFSSVIMLAVHLWPLLLCQICGAPNTKTRLSIICKQLLLPFSMLDFQQHII
jgi:hypothetical protein